MSICWPWMEKPARHSHELYYIYIYTQIAVGFMCRRAVEAGAGGVCYGELARWARIGRHVHVVCKGFHQGSQFSSACLVLVCFLSAVTCQLLLSPTLKMSRINVHVPSWPGIACAVVYWEEAYCYCQDGGGLPQLTSRIRATTAKSANWLHPSCTVIIINKTFFTLK